MDRKIKFGIVQLKVSHDKAENLENASKGIRKAFAMGAELIALPEFFQSPFGNKYFSENAEKIPDGGTCKMLSKIAKELKIYLIGGTIPEQRKDKFFNTCTIWSPAGDLLATYRKMHLFDVDIPGEITFKESDTFLSGDSLTIVNIRGFKIGFGICYDARFEELAKLYRLKGCNMLIYPSLFSMKTGPLHWEISARSRANDNQCYTAMISPSRDPTSHHVAFGNSMVVDPWGQVINNAGTDEAVIVTELDLAVVDKVRSNIPIFKQRRVDIYDTIQK